jgi:hypothetical protein
VTETAPFLTLSQLNDGVTIMMWWIIRTAVSDHIAGFRCAVESYRWELKRARHVRKCQSARVGVEPADNGEGSNR